MDEESYVKHVGQQADSYDRSIQSLFGLDSLLRFDDGPPGGYIPDSLFLPGRSMTPTGPPEALASTHDQTPDVVVQLNTSTGVVGDVKITASNHRDYENAYQQLLRYDCPLAGWCTGTGHIGGHELVLLVDYIHAGGATEYFEGKAYRRPFALLSMARDDQYQSHLVFEKRLGEFAPEHIARKFATRSNIVAVPLERLLGKFGKVKFYDAKPECVEYTMEVLWSEYIPRLPERRSVVQKGGGHTEQRKVSLPEAQRSLEAAYGLVRAVVPEDCMQREPSVPALEWIREALDAFVEIGLGEKAPGDPSVYWVTWRSRLPKPIIERFARKRYRKLNAKHKGRAAKGKPQLSMDELLQ